MLSFDADFKVFLDNRCSPNPALSVFSSSPSPESSAEASHSRYGTRGKNPSQTVPPCTRNVHRQMAPVSLNVELGEKTMEAKEEKTQTDTEKRASVNNNGGSNL